MIRRGTGGNRWWRTSGLGVVLVLSGALLVGGCDDDGGGDDQDMMTDAMDTTMDTSDTSTTLPDTTDTNEEDTTDTNVDDTSDTSDTSDATDTDDTTDADMMVTCGNGALDAGEVCDGTELDGEDCTTVPGGFDGGTLGCNATCDGFDTSACTGGGGTEPVPPSDNCGNGTAEGEYLEACDGADVGTATCDDAGQGYGYTGGTVACTDTCGLDLSGCTGGTVEPGWTCPPGWYGDGQYCDCGCGIVDADCADATAASCQFCGNPGGCDMGAFDCAAIDPADSGSCVAAPSSTCGDGVAELYEACDGTDLRGVEGCSDLGFGSGAIACGSDCRFDFSACEPVPTEWTCDPSFYGAADGCDCGCGIVDPDCADATAGSCEYCNNPGSCGEGAPNDDCSFIEAADNSACVDNCGDGVVDAVEDCDGADLNGVTCADLGYDGTTLACAGDCTFDVSGCGAQVVCGDGTISGNEACDGADLNGATCESLGFEGGTLACGTTSCGFDTSGCTVPAAWTCNPAFFGDGSCDCGCGVADPDCADATSAVCDYCNNLGSCSEGAPSGDCSFIDPADNTTCLDTCGNSMVEAIEDCDGADLNGGTCETVAGGTGTLACGASCDYDTSGCTVACGDNITGGSEVCDGTALDGATCADFGYDGGTLGCNTTCDGYDLSACTTTATCGDNTVAGPERCDGTDLGAFTSQAGISGCTDLGFTGGTLACDSSCGGLDISGCTGGEPVAGWSCPPLFYGDGDCDCGCGAVDSDCTDATAASCDFCGSIYGGSCADVTRSCPADIDPADNSTCVAP